MTSILRRFLVLSALLVGFAGFTGASRMSSPTYTSWIPHLRSIRVIGPATWPVGKSHDCGGMQLPLPNATSPEIKFIFCGPNLTASHQTDVRFWGMISRPDSTPVEEATGEKFSWRCEKDIYGLACKAIN